MHDGSDGVVLVSMHLQCTLTLLSVRPFPKIDRHPQVLLSHEGYVGLACILERCVGWGYILERYVGWGCILERYVGWGCILNCFMLSSLSCFPAFCGSAIPTSFNVFNLVNNWVILCA